MSSNVDYEIKGSLFQLQEIWHLIKENVHAGYNLMKWDVTTLDINKTCVHVSQVQLYG